MAEARSSGGLDESSGEELEYDLTAAEVLEKLEEVGYYGGYGVGGAVTWSIIRVL